MRVYAIKYKLYYGIAGKYSDDSKFTEHTIFYGVDERQRFIKDYQRFKNDGIHYGDIQCFFANMEEIKDMQPIIEAI